MGVVLHGDRRRLDAGERERGVEAVERHGAYRLGKLGLQFRRVRGAGSGRVGKSILEILRFSKVTVRSTLSTWVRVVAKITPKVSAFAWVGLIASAARKLS